MNSEIEQLLLETLSFYEPMKLEDIIIDFDQEKVTDLQEFTMATLQNSLKTLKVQKKIKEVKMNKDKGWIKVYPKKSLLKKIKSFFY